MKKMIKSYMAFATTGYRIVCLLVVPPLYLAFSGFVLATAEEPNGFYPEYMLYMYLIIYEVLSDYWMFGGLCSREGNAMEYVKTSEKGIAVLRKGIVGDLLRRFLYIMAFGAFCCAFTGSWQNLVMSLLAYVVVAGVLNLTRHTAVWQFQMLVGMGAALIFAVFSLVCWLSAASGGKESAALGIELALFGALAIAVSMVTVWHMGYCVKGSYYEK